MVARYQLKIKTKNISTSTFTGQTKADEGCNDPPISSDEDFRRFFESSGPLTTYSPLLSKQSDHNQQRIQRHRKNWSSNRGLRRRSRIVMGECRDRRSHCIYLLVKRRKLVDACSSTSLILFPKSIQV